jgi:cell division protein FtsB
VAKKTKRKAPAVVTAGASRASAWLASVRVSGFTLLIVGLTVMGVAILAPQLNILVQQRQQVAELQSQVAQMKEQVAGVEQQRARWDDPAYIRTQARERLYYVMPGEINFLVVNDVQIQQSRTEAPTAALTTTDTNWVSAALNSVLVAGLSQQAPAAPAETK